LALLFFVLQCTRYAFSLEEKVAFAKQMTDEGLPQGSFTALQT